MVCSSNLRLWAAYNYWCTPDEPRCDPRNFWAVPGVHNRSAATFHDRVTANISWDEALSGRVGIVSERLKTHWLPVIKYRSTCGYGKTVYKKLWEQVSPLTLHTTTQRLPLCSSIHPFGLLSITIYIIYRLKWFSGRREFLQLRNPCWKTSRRRSGGQ